MTDSQCSPDPSADDATPTSTSLSPSERVTQARAALNTAAADRAKEPMLTWSNSQQNTFETCERARYYASELAPHGWRRDAMEVARTAMRLKSLTSLDLALGNTLHERATECAAAIREGDPLPRLSILRQRASTYMRYVWESSRDRYDQWRRYPRDVPMLIERYYGRGPSPERGAQVRERMERGLVALHDLGLWAELAACDPATVLMPDKRTKYTLPDPLAIEPVLVWAVPDLVFQLPHGDWVVVDHKGGRLTDPQSFRRAQRQVVGYAVYLRHGLGVLGPDDGCQGRIVALSDGAEHEWWIRPDEITAAEDDIRRGALAMAAARERADAAEQQARMEAQLSGVARAELPVLVEAARRNAYPMTANRLACRSCPYLELCAPEQAREVDGDPAVSASGEVA